MALTRLSDIADAYTAGRHWSGFWRRGGPAMTAGLWTDLSYAAGIPVANYYAATPYVSAVLSPYDGIAHGPSINAAGYKKYLHKSMLMPIANITTANFYLHDIVMFYPFVDGDGGDQPLDNQIAIPRYGGVGCKIMLVSQGAGIANAQDTVITYTNSDGVQKTWTGFTANANTAGQLISGPTNGTQPAVAGALHGNPYILGQGDKGVRSIDNINMLSGVGGIFAACIVKPLAAISMQTSENTAIEVDYAKDRLRIGMTEIQDGAYLNLIGQSSATQTPATMHGQFDFIWS
jgi:hypothetical protein